MISLASTKPSHALPKLIDGTALFFSHSLPRAFLSPLAIKKVAGKLKMKAEIKRSTLALCICYIFLPNIKKVY